MGVGNWRDVGLIEKQIDKMGNLAEMWPRGKTILGASLGFVH